MSKTHLIAAIVEWGGLGLAPELIVAPDIEEATRRVVEHIGALGSELVGGLPEWSGAGRDWHRENPLPPARGSSLPDLETWLEQLHDHANTPIWTLYRIDTKALTVVDWLSPLYDPPGDTAGPFEPGAETVAEVNDPTCSTCGKTHGPADCEHSEVMS